MPGTDGAPDGSGPGSSSASTPTPNPGPLIGSQDFAGKLIPGAELPQSGISGAKASDWQADTCTDQRQRNWVYWNLFEDYLFYKDMPAIDPNAYAGPPEELFRDLTTRTLPGKDSFSFVLPQAAVEAILQAGGTIGTGAVYDFDDLGRLRVLYVGPGSANGVLSRGAQIVAINGEEVVGSGLTRGQEEALFPSQAGGSVTLRFQDAPGSSPKEVALRNDVLPADPVQSRSVLQDAQTGYLHYTAFATDLESFSGEQTLAGALQYFAERDVKDLVVDLRYNSGGFLFLASELGTMVAGYAATEDKTFERVTFSDKRSAENESIPFYNYGLVSGWLPELKLPRVFVLATGRTCSASESFISALRGIGVEVVLIGGNTCGKPYGFTRQDNCTLSYFALEFEGRNHKGEVFPTTGIEPTCEVADDLSHPLGDPQEALLAAALHYRDNGVCPPPPAGMAHRLSAASAGQRSGVLGRSPLLSNKLLLR